MTQEAVKVFTDAQLTQVIQWAQEEIKSRAEKRKRETIAKIKEMAGEVGVSVRVAPVIGKILKRKLEQRGRDNSDKPQCEAAFGQSKSK